MITTSAAVQEACVVKGDRARERVEAEDKGKREKRQESANRENKKRYLPPPFYLINFSKKVFSKSCNYTVFLLSDTVIVCYL